MAEESKHGNEATSSAHFTIKINNESPIELGDLTKSLDGLADEFRRFVEQEADIPGIEDLKLFVHEIRTGSFFLDAAAIASGVFEFIDYGSKLIEFSRYLNNVCSFFSGKSKKEPSVPKRGLINLNFFVNIIAKNTGSTLVYTPVINRQQLIDDQFEIDSTQANAMQRRIMRKLEDEKEPNKDFYEKVVLSFYQARKDPKSRSGDKAIIEKIQFQPVKTIFANDNIKGRMLSTSENPFKLAYIVDVEVQTINDRVALYKILDFHEKFPITGD